MTQKKTTRVLFVCTGNSGRSQMAEAFVKKLGAGRITAESAGTAPAEELDPTVVRAMEEIGFEMSGQYPKVLTPEMLENADKVITMGCGVNLDDAGHKGAVCPATFVQSDDWGLDDPKGRPIEKVREIRDTIKRKVQELLQEQADE